MTWKLVYTKHAQKDAKNLSSAGLKPKAQELLALIGGEDALKFELPELHRCVVPRFTPRFRDKVRPEEVRDGPIDVCRME